MAEPLVVAYHAVSSTWRSPLAVSEPVLREQLELLAGRGYVGVTLAECERRRRDGGLDGRTLVVTFDDAFRSVLRAKPILDELGFPATVFAVTRFADGGRVLDWPGLAEVGIAASDEPRSLGWGELEGLRDAGWEIGSHTASHPVLVDLDDDRLEEELAGSRDELVRRLGACETVGYPYGLADRRVADVARRVGYSVGVTLTRMQSVAEPLLWPRIGLDDGDRGTRLRFVLSSAAFRLRRSRVLADLERRRGRPSWIPAAPPGRDGAAHGD